MRTASQPPAVHRAFTLMELAVVIALIAILSAVIIPEMRGSYEDAVLRSTSRQLIDLFRLASARSISLNQTCRVRLDHSNGHFTLERQVRGGNRRNGPTFAAVKNVAGAEGTIDQRITFSIQHPGAPASDPNAGPGGYEPQSAAPPSDADAIVFHPDGTADAAQIDLLDRAGFRLSLRISAVTARVQVMEKEGL